MNPFGIRSRPLLISVSHKSSSFCKAGLSVGVRADPCDYVDDAAGCCDVILDVGCATCIGRSDELNYKLSSQTRFHILFKTTLKT